MGFYSKLCYNTWNIGFVESDIYSIIKSDNCEVNVHWVKHDYKDRFFADPFILSINDNEIKVLVEDFPYYHKKGVISLLTIDKKSYELIDRKVVLEQPYHMSYPFIFWKNDGTFWVAPEASQSGKLYRYLMNVENCMLEDQTLLLDRPALDSTIIKYNGKYWLFCTYRGSDSNRCLDIYYSDFAEGPWIAHKKNPVVSNLTKARPAGYMVKIDNNIYRVIQKCDKYYGEAINVSKILKLTESEYEEQFIKELRTVKDEYSRNFHTINGMGDICVVDGIKRTFSPIRRLCYELINIFKCR